MIEIALRLRIAGHRSIGPGKIRLLELIAEHGSISAAGKEMEMAYSHAWTLVNSMNETFLEPVVESHPGGPVGGGARLTPFGAALVKRYRAIEERLRTLSDDDVHALERTLVEAGKKHRSRSP